MDFRDIISANNGRIRQCVGFMVRGFVLGIIFHFAQLAQSGYNGDSLGFGSYYSTYLGELAQGRYGLLLFSGRIVNPTIEFMGAIALYAMASWLIIEILRIEINSLSALLVQAIFISQPHIATYSTFHYASFPYTLAYFLMILAVWLIKISVSRRMSDLKRSNIFALLSVFSIAASFSIWQAYIPTFTTLVFILILFENDNKKRLHTIATAAISAIGGTALYVIGMKLVNNICGVTPTDARGFADVLALNLPLFRHPVVTMRDCYEIFIKYLLDNSIVYNGVRLVGVHVILGLCMVVVTVFWLKGKEKKDFVLSFILLLLTPVAFCFYRIISEDVSRVPWTYLHSMIFIWILFLAILNKIRIQKKIVYVTSSLLIGYVICRQIYICNTIYQSVLERDMKSTAMAISMYTRLAENEEWDSNIPVMVIGSMDTIYPDYNWYYLNTLKGWQPQINEFLPYPGMPQNWVVQINKIYGTQFQLIDYRWKNYQDVLASSEYSNMDVWPSSGSMRIIDGVMVIKLGELE